MPSRLSLIKRFGFGVLALVSAFALFHVAFAENKNVTLWSGITGTGDTFGTQGQCGPTHPHRLMFTICKRTVNYTQHRTGFTCSIPTSNLPSIPIVRRKHSCLGPIVITIIRLRVMFGRAPQAQQA